MGLFTKVARRFLKDHDAGDPSVMQKSGERVEEGRRVLGIKPRGVFDPVDPDREAESRTIAH